MTTIFKSAFAAVALSVMAAGAALAAEACCCKDMKERMSCCDEMKKGEPATAGPAAPQHQH